MSVSQAKTFMLAALTVSVPTCSIAFNLGVYDTIFFEHTFYIWIASLTVFVASLFVPNGKSPVRWAGRLVLALPTVWIIVTLLVDPANGLSTVNPFLLIFGLIVFLLCLPYILYVIASIANPELIAVRSPRLVFALVLIVVLIGLIAFVVGENNAWFLTCFDFEVSGNAIPANCRN